MEWLTKDLHELYERAKGYQQNQAPSPCYSTGLTDGFYEGVRYVFDKIAEQSRISLTLEELRRMGEEPVWVTPAKEGGKILKRWMLLECFSEDIDLFLFRPSCGIAQGYTGAGYGKIWLAYRRRPEEGKT